MSNHLFRIFAYTLKSRNSKAPAELTPTEQAARSIVLLTAAGIHAAYAYSTGKTEEIRIVQKYKMNRYGYTDFMVIDQKGRHFNVNNSLWYWKWDSIEDWARIQKGDSVSVQYYGWRKPIIGLFPNIVQTDKILTL